MKEEHLDGVSHNRDSRLPRHVFHYPTDEWKNLIVAQYKEVESTVGRYAHMSLRGGIDERESGRS